MRSINKLVAISIMWFTIPQVSFAQKKHFEGEITHNVSITLDKTARKFLKGSDGAYEMKTIYKNGNELNHEGYYGFITLISRAKDSVYMYQPDIKKGYKCSFSASIADFKETRKEMKSYISSTGEAKEMYGITFKRYKGEETSDATLDTSDQLDYWICPDFDDTWVSNIKVPGLIQYLDYFNKTKIPILGTMTQHLEMSIKELKVREVSDSEFALPTDITFTLVSTQATAESKLKKDHKKWTKEHGKKVGEDIQTRGAAKTKGDWDF